jgi:PPM family protein phosphatase
VLGAAADHDVPAVASTDDAAEPEVPARRVSHGAVALGAVAPAAGGAGGGAAGGHEDDEARYNPRPPRPRRLVRPLLGVLVLLLVAAAALGSGYAWTRTQYYVGSAGEQVAIYQGLPGRLLVPLSRVYEVQQVPMSSLPPFYADRVRAGIEVASLEAARQAVTELTEASKRCAAAHPSASPSPSPSGKGTPHASATPAASASSESSATGPPASETSC